MQFSVDTFSDGVWSVDLAASDGHRILRQSVRQGPVVPLTLGRQNIVTLFIIITIIFIVSVASSSAPIYRVVFRHGICHGRTDIVRVK